LAHEATEVPNQTLLAVVVFYVILGMFMETLSMMVATVPIITPVVMAPASTRCGSRS
jgi:TRAP-type C4-dicarboxylate transport system permease large subunit